MKRIKLSKTLRLKIMLHLRHAFKKLTVHSLIDSVEDLDIVMSMYNLLEQSQNYSMTSESLWNYYRDEIDDVGDNVSDGTSSRYKTKIVGKTSKSRWNSTTTTTTTSSTNFEC